MGKVEGLFGDGVVSGEEKTLEALMERATIISGLPVDYNILLHKGRTRTNVESSSTNMVRTRTTDGALTSIGREQLVKN